LRAQLAFSVKSKLASSVSVDNMGVELIKFHFIYSSKPKHYFQKELFALMYLGCDNNGIQPEAISVK
jgi:hypothetical protein